MLANATDQSRIARTFLKRAAAVAAVAGLGGGIVLARQRPARVAKRRQEGDRHRHRRHGPAAVRKHDGAKASCPTWPSCEPPAASAAGHQHSAAKPGRLGQLHQRRRARLARHLRLHPPPSARAVHAVLLRRRDARRRREAGRSATTSCSSTSGRSTTSRRRRCCGARACRSGTTSTPPASPRPSTTCRRTTRPARRSTATTAASAAWARPTCWAPTARTSTSPRTAQPNASMKAAASGRELVVRGRDGRSHASSGPENSHSQDAHAGQRSSFYVHRDREANAAVIEIQGKRILLKARPVEPLDASSTSNCRMPCAPAEQARSAASAASTCRKSRRTSGCTSSPINIDPAGPAVPTFRAAVVHPGRREDAWARSTPPGFRRTTRPARTASSTTTSSSSRRTCPGGAAGAVRVRRRELRRRPAVLLLLQQRPAVAHVLVELRREAPDPLGADEAKKYFGHVKRLYQRLDQVVGD